MNAVARPLARAPSDFLLLQVSVVELSCIGLVPLRIKLLSSLHLSFELLDDSLWLLLLVISYYRGLLTGSFLLFGC